MSIGFNFKSLAALAPHKRVSLCFEALKPGVDFSCLVIKVLDGRLPWWSSGKLHSNAGDTGSIPGRRTKIPTCCRATKPARHNYCACLPQRESLRAANYRAHVLWSPRGTTREKPVLCNEEPACRS